MEMSELDKLCSGPEKTREQEIQIKECQMIRGWIKEEYDRLISEGDDSYAVQTLRVLMEQISERIGAI